MRPVPLWRRYDRLLGSDVAADVKDELRFHLESRVEDLVAKGWHLEDARKEAERQFGNILAVQHVGERIGERMDRRRRLTEYWADSLRDLRFTLHILRPQRRLYRCRRPYSGPRHRRKHRRLQCRQYDPAAPSAFPSLGTTCPHSSEAPPGRRLWHDVLRGRHAGFPAAKSVVSANDRLFCLFRSSQCQAHRAGPAAAVTGMMVAGNFFPTLGVTPVLGRDFAVEETLKNSRPVALISYRFWKRQYAADTAIVGRTIGLDGAQVTVVGVLPETFDFGAVFASGTRVDLFTPAILGDMEHWGNTMALVGRLKPGVTRQGTG